MRFSSGEKTGSTAAIAFQPTPVRAAGAGVAACATAASPEVEASEAPLATSRRVNPISPRSRKRSRGALRRQRSMTRRTVGGVSAGSRS